MLKANVQEALNNQINGEIASTYLYLSMTAYFESKNFHGMAKWMEFQAREEWGHAMKIFGHVNERNGRRHPQADRRPAERMEVGAGRLRAHAQRTKSKSPRRSTPW